jgi:hypothetical protein
MKTLFCTSILALAFVACATVPQRTARAGDETPRLPPGARCDYDDQCGSGICDAYECRGPALEP